jgi:hypothetical protein
VNTLRRERMDELSMHPTVKPVAMMSDAIKDASRRGEIVLDPFGGSGSTLIAAERTRRRAETTTSATAGLPHTRASRREHRAIPGAGRGSRSRV